MKKKLLSIIIIMLAIFLAGCSSADRYDKGGKKLFKSGKYEEAAQSFSKAITANPNRADYYIDYGMSLIAMGKYEEALKQFHNIYKNKDMSIVMKNNKRALRGAGIAYYYLQNYKDAVKEFDKALKINELPELNVDILYYKGSSLRTVGFYQDAIDTYSTILSEDKKDAIAYAERAYCYQGLNKYEESLKDYDSAISLEPDHYGYYFDKYNLLVMKGDTKGAREVLTQASKIEVKTEQDRYNLAMLHFYQGNINKALTEFENCLSKGIYEADYYIGEIYRISKDDTKAIYYYDQYINTGKIQSSNVYNQLAVCLINTQDYKKAIEYLKEGIARKEAGTLKILKKNEIVAYEKSGDFDMADKKLNEYRKAYPGDKDADREAQFIDTRLIKAETE